MGARWRCWAWALLSVAICLGAFRFSGGNEGSLVPRSPDISPAETIPDAQPATSLPQTAKRRERTTGWEPVPHALLQRFSDPDANVRLRALKQLNGLGVSTAESISILTAFLADADPRIRAYAALRLGSYSMAATDAVPVLKELAFTDPNDLVRSRAKDALVNIRLYDFSPMTTGRDF